MWNNLQTFGKVIYKRTHAAHRKLQPQIYFTTALLRSHRISLRWSSLWVGVTIRGVLMPAVHENVSILHAACLSIMQMGPSSAFHVFKHHVPANRIGPLTFSTGGCSEMRIPHQWQDECSHHNMGHCHL
jgi:hypothetical protein